MRELKKIEFKNTLNTLVKENALVKRIIQLLHDQFDDEKLLQLKDDFQFLIDICNFVENSVSSKNKGKLNKKEIVLAVYSHLFSLCEEDIHKIDTGINTIHANGLIKKRSFFLTIIMLVVSFFSGKHI